MNYLYPLRLCSQVGHHFFDLIDIGPNFVPTQVPSKTLDAQLLTLPAHQFLSGFGIVVICLVRGL